MKPIVESFFHDDTFTWTHLVQDPDSDACAVVDPVLDFDAASGRLRTTTVDALIDRIRTLGLRVEWILETHVHADHLSGAARIREILGGRIAIGDHVACVQKVFGDLFNAEADFARDGSQFDRLLADGERFHVGGLEAEVLHTPGHTPACSTYVFDGAAFVGDTIFAPDFGTARTDFPGGDARTLYRSVQRILALPPETLLYLCHDYLPEAREEYVASTTVAAEREGNVHVHEGVSEAEFVAFREARDAELPAPRLLLPSVQFNMRGGALPPAEGNGMHYLKLPVLAA